MSFSRKLSSAAMTACASAGPASGDSSKAATASAHSVRHSASCRRAAAASCSAAGRCFSNRSSCRAACLRSSRSASIRVAMRCARSSRPASDSSPGAGSPIFSNSRCTSWRCVPICAASCARSSRRLRISAARSASGRAAGARPASRAATAARFRPHPTAAPFVQPQLALLLPGRRPGRQGRQPFVRLPPLGHQLCLFGHPADSRRNRSATASARSTLRAYA